MRKHIAVIIILSIISFVFSSCKINSKPQTETVIPKTDESEFIKAVWLNYNELAMKNEPDKSEKAFREKIQTVINNCADNGFNRIIFQERPFSTSKIKAKNNSKFVQSLNSNAKNINNKNDFEYF